MHKCLSNLSHYLWDCRGITALQNYFMRIFYKNIKNVFRALKNKFFPHPQLKRCYCLIDDGNRWTRI